MGWEIEKVYNFKWKKTWEPGVAHFGFHGHDGTPYVINTEFNWVGCVDMHEDALVWSAGPKPVQGSKHHFDLDIKVPNSGSCAKDNSVLISSEANNKIFKIIPHENRAYEFFDANKYGLKYIGSCEYDLDGNVWVIELTGCRVWKLNPQGEPILTIGSGNKGFQQGTVSFEKAEFNWMSCIKCGADGNLYLVDSGNYAIRMINPYEKWVKTIVGNGTPGYDGDGGDAALATLGESDMPVPFYEGPWYLSLDNDCNIYIADTGNSVVRMVDKKTNIISTIAGNTNSNRYKRVAPDEKDPMKMNMPYIVSVEYFNDRLYVCDWRGDLVILRKG